MPSTINMKLDTIYFDYIKNKKKLYETRIYDEKRRSINLLDIVKFTDISNKERTFEAVITELSYFDNFHDAIQEVGVKKVLPNAKSLKQAVEIYNSFPHGEKGTYKQASKELGFLRMKFKLVN